MKSKSKKINVYEIVNNKILERMAAGRIPWVKPYDVAPAQNLVSGHVYHGINAILLSGLYKTPYYVSYKQAASIDAKLKKDQHGNLVVFWTIFNSTKTDKDGNEKLQKVPYLKYSYVFNVEQFESIDHKKLKVEQKKAKKMNPIKTAEEIVNNYKTKPVIEIKERIPCYIPSLDVVQVPSKEKFKDVKSYYSTLFHELVHSTGAKHRLNREFGTSFGSEKYSKEELIAEIGASFLNAKAGIDAENLIENSAAYIQGWMRVIKDDNRLFISAASKAQKAVEYITNENSKEVSE